MHERTLLIEQIDASFTDFVRANLRYPDCIFISTSAYDKLVTEIRSQPYNTADVYKSIVHPRSITAGDNGLFLCGLCVHRFVSDEPKWFFGVYGGMDV